MDLPSEDNQKLSLTAYTAEPGSPSQDALTLLASWAATTPGDSNQPSTDQRAI